MSRSTLLTLGAIWAGLLLPACATSPTQVPEWKSAGKKAASNCGMEVTGRMEANKKADVVWITFKNTSIYQKVVMAARTRFVEPGIPLDPDKISAGGDASFVLGSQREGSVVIELPSKDFVREHERLVFSVPVVTVHNREECLVTTELKVDPALTRTEASITDLSRYGAVIDVGLPLLAGGGRSSLPGSGFSTQLGGYYFFGARHGLAGSLLIERMRSMDGALLPPVDGQSLSGVASATELALRLGYLHRWAMTHATSLWLEAAPTYTLFNWGRENRVGNANAFGLSLQSAVDFRMFTHAGFGPSSWGPNAEFGVGLVLFYSWVPSVSRDDVPLDGHILGLMFRLRFGD